MPPDSGMAFVLVQHLDPEHPSLLPELLAPHTRMPVHPVVDRMSLAPDHVYLIPPNTTLTIDQGMLCLATPIQARGHRTAIDHFFHSLAANQGNRAVGIILSGTGTDGTLGLMAIKECAGMTMAQAPESARYDAMPRSAIDRGVVDHTVPIVQMPAVLLAYARHGRASCCSLKPTHRRRKPLMDCARFATCFVRRRGTTLATTSRPRCSDRSGAVCRCCTSAS
jgi:two-component system CheB/CheR fusion protein